MTPDDVWLSYDTGTWSCWVTSPRGLTTEGDTATGEVTRVTQGHPSPRSALKAAGIDVQSFAARICRECARGVPLLQNERWHLGRPHIFSSEYERSPCQLYDLERIATGLL